MADKTEHKDEQKGKPQAEARQSDANRPTPSASKHTAIGSHVRPVGYGESRKIIRLLSTDLPGDLTIKRALRRIKGIGFMFAHAICLSLDIDEKKKVGAFSPEELKRIEDFVKSHGQAEAKEQQSDAKGVGSRLPAWMFNRRKDYETGTNFHFVMSTLDLKKMEDINTMKRIRAYRGIRHELGLPVRGQRTRSSFRRNKTMGVSKRKAMPGKAAPSAVKPAEKK